MYPVTRFRAAVSVLVGPCCPALLNCIDVDEHPFNALTLLVGRQEGHPAYKN